jgi:hypothetical protein
MHRIKEVRVYMYKLITLKKNHLKQISCNYFFNFQQCSESVQILLCIDSYATTKSRESEQTSFCARNSEQSLNKF